MFFPPPRRPARQNRLEASRRLPGLQHPCTVHALEPRTFLAAAGSLDTSFGTGGRVTRTLALPELASPYDVALQPDGKILATAVTSLVALAELELARFNPDGSLDTTFANGWGIADTGLTWRSGALLHDIAVAPDGKILVAGDPGVAGRFGVVRFNTDGTLDPTFGTRGMTLGPSSLAVGVRALAVAPDGKVLVGGEARDDFYLTRFTPGGEVDTGFGDNGQVFTAFAGAHDAVRGISVLPDGRILAVGDAWYSDGATSRPAFGAARYNPDGSPDTTFGGGDGRIGGAPAAPVDSLVGGPLVLADGRFVVTGVGPAGITAARFNADGSPDTTFGEAGVAPGVTGQGYVMPDDAALGPDGSVFISGGTSTGRFANYLNGLLVKYTPDGRLDPAFGNGGSLIGPEIGPANSGFLRGMDVRPDGRPVVAYSGTDTLLHLRSYTPGGQPDAAFGGGDGAATVPLPHGTTDLTTAMVRQAGGKTVLVGNSGPFDNFGLSNGVVYRFNADGSADASFGAGGVARPDFGPLDERWYAAAGLPDGKLILGGTYVEGQTGHRRLFARLNADGSPDMTFGAGGFVLGPAGMVTELEPLPDGRLLAAGGDHPEVNFLAWLSRYSAAGQLDPSFGSAGEVGLATLGGMVSDIGLLADGRFYATVAEVVPTTGVPVPSRGDRPRVLRFNPDGSLDATFGTGGRANVNADDEAPMVTLTSLAVDGAGRVLAAGARRSDPQSTTWDAAVYRFRPDGNPDASFGDGGRWVQDLGSAYDQVGDLALQGDGKVVLAAVGDGQYSYPRALVVGRLLPDGTPDPWFGDHGFARPEQDRATTTAVGVAITGEGKIQVAGSAILPDPSAARTSFDFVLAQVLGEGLGADAGGPYSGDEGTDLVLGGAGDALPGRTIVRYEWDFNYDGATFDADAIGAAAVIPGRSLDGHSDRLVALRVTDSAGETTIDTAPLHVFNIDPVLSVSGAPTTQAGQLYSLALSVVDPGDDRVTWRIDWGDGMVETVPGDRPTATHTYVDGNNRYRISPAASDDDGFYLAQFLDVLVQGINDPPVVNDADLVPSAAAINEGGRAETNYSLRGGFADPDNVDAHTVLVSWGDGSPDTVIELPAGERFFEGAHRYADDNPSGTAQDTYVVVVTVFDGAVSDTAGAQVVVRNVAPTASAGADRGVLEGGSVTLSATVTDPGAGPTETFRYLWHVTASNGRSVPDGDQATFTLNAVDDGTYTVTLTVTDDDGGSATDTVYVVAANVAPTLTATPASPAVEGSPFTLNLSAQDPGPDTLTSWTIDWGDGAVNTLPGAATNASHTYADGPHAYRVRVIGTDEDGTYAASSPAAAPASPDPTFGTNGVVDRLGLINDAAIKPDGKIVVVDGGPPDPPIPWRVAQFNSDGTPDTAFGTNGVVTDPAGQLFSQAVAVQPDGRIVVVGYGQGPGYQAAVVARYNANGTRDTTFGQNGVVNLRYGSAFINRFFDVAVLPGGKIVAVGNFGNTNVDYDLFAARFNPDGSSDPTFGDGGRTAGVDVGSVPVQVVTLLVQQDGKLVLGGQTRRGVSGASRLVLARFNADGRADAGFGTGGVVETDISRQSVPPGVQRVNDLAQAPDGAIVAAASLVLTSTTSDAVILRYLPDGTLDPSFGTGGIVRRSGASDGLGGSVAVTPDGGVLYGGRGSGGRPGTDGFLLAHYTRSGAVDTSFGNGGSLVVPVRFSIPRTAAEAQKFLLQPDGRIFAAGWGGMTWVLPGGEAVNVANAPPTAKFSAAGPAAAGQPATVRFDNPADASAADTAAGFRFSYDLNNDGDFADPGEADGVTSPSASFVFPAAGVYTVRGRVADKDGGFTDYATDARVVSAVAGRHVFYNGSGFDGNDGAASAADDAAVAPDKAALLPREAGTFANVTGYVKGINGVMVDVFGLPRGVTLTADDFSFRSGASGSRANWAAGPRPVAVTVRYGAGVNGADRVTLVWSDAGPGADPATSAVAGGWLEVTVKANANTGLASPDVFAFGNLIGATGSTPLAGATLRVSALDLAAVRRSLGATSAINSVTDLNRDGRTNALDLALVKRNLNRGLALVQAEA